MVFGWWDLDIREFGQRENGDGENGGVQHCGEVKKGEENVT
jgi:hypothetical protein